MTKKLFLRSILVAVTALSATFLAPVAQATVATEAKAMTSTDTTGEGDGITAAEIAGASSIPTAAPPPGGWDTPSQRSYYLLSSCRPYAQAISQGAAAWNGLNEGGGTPVECRDSYITDCGGGSRVVGCNWGRGERIALYMGGVSDNALLAAHEFGHDWYGHSNYRCAGWSNPEHVMAPSMCGGLTSGTVQVIDHEAAE